MCISRKGIKKILFTPYTQRINIVKDSPQVFSASTRYILTRNKNGNYGYKTVMGKCSS